MKNWETEGGPFINTIIKHYGLAPIENGETKYDGQRVLMITERLQLLAMLRTLKVGVPTDIYQQWQTIWTDMHYTVYTQLPTGQGKPKVLQINLPTHEFFDVKQEHSRSLWYLDIFGPGTLNDELDRWEATPTS